MFATTVAVVIEPSQGETAEWVAEYLTSDYPTIGYDVTDEVTWTGTVVRLTGDAAEIAELICENGLVEVQA